jgi:glycerol-3-phosphate acyltransferase PlsY
MDNLLTLLYTLGFALLGYLCGSLPFAVWITHLFKGVDVREAGSGPAAAPSLRSGQAQPPPGVLREAHPLGHSEPGS